MVQSIETVGNKMLQLVWPSLLLALLQAFITAFDARLAGHIGADALAAITLIYPFFLLMQTVSLGGFGGAVAANVAKAVASKNSALATQGIIVSLGLSLVIGLLCSVLFLTLGKYFINYFVESKVIAQMAYRYGFWMLGLAPAFWVCNCLLSIARGLGMVKYLLGVACLVYSLQMTVAGILVLKGIVPDVAILSVSSFIGISLFGGFIGARLWKHSHFVPELNVITYNMREAIVSLISTGFYTSLSSVITGVSLILLSVVVTSRFGLEALGGFGIVFRVEVILMSFASCIGVAVVTVGATSMGRHDIKNTIHVGTIGVLSTVTLIGSFGIIVALRPDVILRYFILNPESVSVASNYLRIVGWSYPLMAFGFASFFVGQSIGRPRWFFAAALARFLFLIGVLSMAAPVFSSFILFIAAGYGLFGVLAFVALAHQRSLLVLEHQKFRTLSTPAQELLAHASCKV